MNDFLNSMLIETVKNPVKQNAFRTFLEDKCSDENLAFYLLVEDFHKVTDSETLHSLAKMLYSIYIDDSAQNRLNMDEILVKEISTKLELSDISTTLFDGAQKFIFEILSKSTFPGFMKSIHFARIFFTYDSFKQMPLEIFIRIKQNIEAGSWDYLMSKRGVDFSIKKLSEGKYDRFYIRGSIEIIEPKSILPQLKNISLTRKEWDRCFSCGKLVETITPECEIYHLIYKQKKILENYTVMMAYTEFDEDPNTFTLVNINVKHYAVTVDCQNKDELSYYCQYTPNKTFILHCIIQFENNNQITQQQIKENIQKIDSKHLLKLQKIALKYYNKKKHGLKSLEIRSPRELDTARRSYDATHKKQIISSSRSIGERDKPLVTTSSDISLPELRDSKKLRSRSRSLTNEKTPALDKSSYRDKNKKSPRMHSPTTNPTKAVRTNTISLRNSNSGKSKVSREEK